MNDKARPLAERIAALDVRTSFRDLRDGIGRGGVPDISDQDLAAALGMVKSRLGPLPVIALETYYGSTLRHERRLRDEWGHHHENGDMSRAERILSRFACAIAVRQFSGVRHIDADMAEYSYLMAMRPRDFGKAVGEVLAWLEDYRATGLGELRKICRVTPVVVDTA